MKLMKEPLAVSADVINKFSASSLFLFGAFWGVFRSVKSSASSLGLCSSSFCLYIGQHGAVTG